MAKILQEQLNERIDLVVSHSRKLHGQDRAEIEKLYAESLKFEVIQEEIREVKKEVEKKEPITPKTIIVSEIPEVDIPIPKETPKEDISTHRYLQTLVKKMAEARGYIATLEVATPDGNGSVDVLLSKEERTIAIEICNTTDADWEMHNISKCMGAGYSTIISLSGDLKQLERIKQKCKTGNPEFDSHDIHFFTPDALFSFLDMIKKSESPTEKTMKGYRVNVSYDSITPEEMSRKRTSVAQVVLNSMKRIKKK